jgi:hypothetical protein
MLAMTLRRPGCQHRVRRFTQEYLEDAPSCAPVASAYDAREPPTSQRRLIAGCCRNEVW